MPKSRSPHADSRLANLQALIRTRYDGVVSQLALAMNVRPQELYRVLPNKAGSMEAATKRDVPPDLGRKIERAAELATGTLDLDPPAFLELLARHEDPPDEPADTSDVDNRLTWAIDNQPEEPRLSREQLAKQLGIDVSEIRAAEAGEGRPAKLIARLAPLLRASAVWIIGGSGARHTVVAKGMQMHGAKREGSLLKGDNYVAIMGDVPHRMLPILGKVSAGAYMEAYEAALSHPDDHKLMACPIACGPRSFWVTVEGRSMTSPTGDTYPAGTMIAFDCDKLPVEGRPVIARLLTGECTLKNYEIDGDGSPFLLAVNPDWPDRRTPMPEGTHVCASYVCRFLV